MAEAHQGVAFSFAVSEDEGLHLNVSYEALRAVLNSGVRNWRKRLARFINSVLNGVFPSHPTRGLIVIGVITGLHLYKKKDVSFGIIDLIKDKIPLSVVKPDTAEVVSCILFGTGLWLMSVTVRRYSLKILFSYHGWMYQTHGKLTLKNKLWMALIKLIVSRKPQLFSYQSSLPHLPLPALDDTISRYLRTVRPLYEDEHYARIEKSAKEFQKTLGKRLQRYLIFKSWISSNYVSDWWEEYVYLRGRSPIMVNSNFYCLDSILSKSTNIQAARAANIIYAAFLYRRDLDNENLNPIIIQDMIPLCSRQYDRQFNTTRIPGEITDKLVHLIDSKHVAVYCNGKWFKLPVYYRSKLLNAKELEIQLQKIIDEDTEATNGEKFLGALTAGDRIPWAQTRNKYFAKGINKSSLDAIEKSAFVVILEDVDYTLIPKEEKKMSTVNDERQLDMYGRSMLHGKGYDRWFDKSFNFIVSKSGKVGVNTEHSWADAPITGHLWEYVLGDDHAKLGYDENGHTKGTVRFELPEPLKLKWEINSKCQEAIDASLKVATALLNDVDIHIYIHDLFGKGVMKAAKVSPDAFIQMSLQLAYFRDIGRHHLTYESAMTRLFREGRTETVRSCSIESCNWIKAMEDPNAKNSDKVQLLRKACDFHQQQYRDAMTGKGIDRHIFCLYVVSRYLEVDSPFLKEVLSEPWRLSTSQTPTNQTSKIDLKKYPDLFSAGGGFGPVADDGYGVSYMIMDEDRLTFHISSKKSSDKTNSHRFGEQIRKAMCDVKLIFEQDRAEKAAAQPQIKN